METSSVPVTLDGLGLEGDPDTELLGDTVEDEARHPEVVTHCWELALNFHRPEQLNLLSIPGQGPTWYSHWEGMTSALIPEMLIPANKQAR